MPEVTREFRTIMYSVRQEKGHEGELVVHKFPFNANDKYGMIKLQKLAKRGFTFQPPSTVGVSVPQVIVTEVVDLSKPVLVVESPTPAEILKSKRQAQMAKARAAKAAKRKGVTNEQS